MRAFWISLVLLLVTVSAQAIGVPTCQVGTNNGTTTVTTASLSVTKGDLVIFSSGQQSDNSSTYTVSDSGGNTWTDAAAGYAPADTGETQKLSWAIAAATTSITVTATWNNVVGTSTAIVCNASGILASNPEDTSVNNPGSGTITSLNSGSFTTTNSNALLFNCVRMSAGVTSPTAGTNFTIPTNGTAGARHTCEYRIVGAPQTGVSTSLSWTGAVHASSAFAAFKAAPVVPTRKPLMF